MAGWRAQPAADDGTKYGTMIHREYYTLIRVLRPMAQLYFYYSAMNAGKSTALLQSSYNYQERGMRTVVYTAEIDDRFGAGKVSSRIGLSSPARLFNPETDLLEDIRAEHAFKPVHCVLVDGLAPIFPYTFYHLTHYWFAARYSRGERYPSALCGCHSL